MTRTKRRESSGARNWDGWEPYSPVAGIYGANASGKSNFISALMFFQRAIADSHASWDPTQAVPLPPRFALGQSSDESSRFECEMLIENVRYQYGFEANSKRIAREWLYSYPKKLQRIVFERNVEDPEVWYFGDTLKGRTRVIAELTRDNSLYLSAAASNNHPLLTKIFAWFTQNIAFASPNDHESRLRYSIVQLQREPQVREKIMSLLKNADLGIDDVQFEYPEVSDSQVESLLKSMREDPDFDESAYDEEYVRTVLAQMRAGVELKHRSASAAGMVALPLGEESTGTQALLGLSGPIFEALEHGRTLIIDEIDTSLHPVLVRAIVNLFKSRTLNTQGAQLIFSSHDVSLLMQDTFDEALLDRDQIWFVEKNDFGESLMYPLTDFKTRPSHSLLRGYLQGRYGAVPRIEWRDMLPAMVSSDED